MLPHVSQMIKGVEENLSIEDCDEMLGILSAARSQKELAKKKPTPKVRQCNPRDPSARSGHVLWQGGAKKPAQKTKKDVKKEKDAHADLFGGFVEDEYDHYDE